MSDDEGQGLRANKKGNIPILTMRNWNTEFRDAFKDYALSKRSGEIIISGVDPNEHMRVPARNMRVLVRNEAGEMVESDRQMFADSDRGDRQFNEYEKKYTKILEGKKELLYQLLSHMDREVKDKVKAEGTFQELYDRFDVLGIWNLTQQVVIGVGSMSVYNVISRLLRLKQKGMYVTYQREFQDLVADVRSQGTADEILEKIFDSLFILGVDQEQFKDVLTPVYGRRVWPRYADLAAQLSIYAEQTERMASFNTRNDNDGRIEANVVKMGGDGPGPNWECFNCGGKNHRSRECVKSKHQCKKCHSYGHLEKFCEKIKEIASRGNWRNSGDKSGAREREQERVKGEEK
jgi:hypothetical protein